jgi:hypothetical protein
MVVIESSPDIIELVVKVIHLQMPSIIEGFLMKWRDWIRGDAVVREVCYAHLLRLTRLRLLAPMQTQHCLKMLNGTCTPCPDYMFDHLRPADFVPQSDVLRKRGRDGNGRVLTGNLRDASGLHIGRTTLASTAERCKQVTEYQEAHRQNARRHRNRQFGHPTVNIPAATRMINHHLEL